MSPPIPASADRVLNELEQSLVGACLLDPAGACAAAAAQGLTPQLLCDDQNRHIFAALVYRVARGEPVDIVTVHTRLVDTGEGDRCGGLAYLNALQLCVPSAQNAGYYAAQLVKRHHRRQDETNLLALARQAADPLLADETYAARRAELLADIANTTHGAATTKHFTEINFGGLAESKPPPPAYWWQG